MAVKCRLFGHEWGAWIKQGEHKEFDSIYKNGERLGKKIILVRSKTRTCNRCGKEDTTTSRQKKGERRLSDDVDVALPPDEIPPRDHLSKEESSEFFNELQQFVEEERSSEVQSNWQSYDAMDIDTAINQGHLIGPFEPIENVEEFWFRLAENDGEDGNRRMSNFSRDDLFEGSFYIADSPSLEDSLPIEIEVEEVKFNSRSLHLRPRRESTDDKVINKAFTNGSKIYLHELLNPLPYERRLNALENIKTDRRKKHILTGDHTARFTHRYPAPDSHLTLNEYQQQALVWANCADDFLLIHGPPGTGKTRTLTAYVRHAAVDEDQAVLVTAHSNQAVDNLLVGDSTREEPESGTLHAMAQSPDSNLSIARMGNNSENSVVKEHYEIGSKDSVESATNFDVVASTTSGAAKFDADQFDVAVVDEATQVSRPATAIALNCAEKIILAGDHKQLWPYAGNNEMKEQEMHISLFEHLLKRYREDITALLRRQYRMNEMIAEFPNQTFYEGQLETAPGNRDWQVDGLKPLIGLDVSGTERRSEGRSYYNTAEAKVAARQVQLLIKNDVAPADIGVISAYSGQIPELRKRVRGIDIAHPERVSIDTVDSFQGGEREAIIVSFVRSNDECRSGFLERPDEGPRRLNVALTRARKRLVVIGDWRTLGTVPSGWSANDSCASVYADLAEHIRSRGWMEKR